MDKVLLFTTPSCGQCPAAKAMLKDFEVEIINALDHPDLTEQYGIMSVPTVIYDGKKYTNLDGIQTLVKSVSSL